MNVARCPMSVLMLPLLLASCAMDQDDAQTNEVTTGEIAGCTPHTTVGHTGRATLMPGEGLMTGEILRAGDTALTMQSDCNLVLYYSPPPSFQRRALWSSRTNGQGKTCYAHMQTDGNLVVYSQPVCWNPVAVWASGTNGQPGAYMRVQTDGNLVLYRDDRAIWASNTVQSPGSGSEPDSREGCRFARTETKCGHLPDILPGILACRQIYTCDSNSSVLPTEVADSWTACGPCFAGKS